MGEASLPSSLRIQMRPPDAEGLCRIDGRVEVLAGKLLAFEGDALYGPAAVDRLLEYAELPWRRKGGVRSSMGSSNRRSGLSVP